MKVRCGFVANSSSASFVCAVCGWAEGGMDFSLSDVGMVCCENGHEVCYTHLTEKARSEIYEGQGDIAERYCPICAFEKAYAKDVLDFVLADLGLVVEDVLSVIKGKHGTYTAFREWLKSVSRDK